jgi:hypothetical protein
MVVISAHKTKSTEEETQDTELNSSSRHYPVSAETRPRRDRADAGATASARRMRRVLVTWTSGP